MGLDIHVGHTNYYSHSYSAIHFLRLFAAQKEWPYKNITKETMYDIPYYRFPALIQHSDCGDGYIPFGVKPPYKHKDVSLAFQWPSTEALLHELKELGKYRKEMNEDVATLYDELLAAAKASIAEKKPIEFH